MGSGSKNDLGGWVSPNKTDYALRRICIYIYIYSIAILYYSAGTPQDWSGMGTRTLLAPKAPRAPDDVKDA